MGTPGSGVTDIIQGRESMHEYTNYGDIREGIIARYLFKEDKDWSYEHCGEYTIYYKPDKVNPNKYETLAVIKTDNSTCTKEVFIPIGKIESFKEVIG